jgi:hypothetical protein
MRYGLTILTLAVIAAGTLSLGGDFAHQVKGLAACKDRAPAVPSSWERKTLGDTFSFALPACFAPVEEKELRYVHGGQRWQCDKTTVEVVWGMWGADSFGDGGERCTTTVGGTRVMVRVHQDDDGPSILVWYPTHGVHEPLVSAWSSRVEDKDLVRTIALSGVIGDAK